MTSAHGAVENEDLPLLRELLDSDVQNLGDAARPALDRSRLLTEVVDTKTQDSEPIRAAGFKTQKQFVAVTVKCTSRCDDGSTASVRAATKAAKGLSWLADDDAVE
ncbi:hypothetical protein ACFVWG_25615 [Kribbella sp. NPDC058245]|uniref:hypothetical protein n=1 Tax=Kribbella sp. NPDC058245 TaxID=3346399 RepID=UPI0036ECA764